MEVAVLSYETSARHTCSKKVGVRFMAGTAAPTRRGGRRSETWGSSASAAKVRDVGEVEGMRVDTKRRTDGATRSDRRFE